MADLSVEICGMKLPNPTMLAAGVLDETGRTMVEVARAGAGAVVTKSVGKEAREGHPNPTVVELEFGLLNAMGLPNPGMNLFSSQISIAKEAGIPIIGSVIGGTDEEIAEVAAMMAGSGVDAIELNLSCPHAKGYGAEIGSDPEDVKRICRAVKDGLNIPLLAKLTPNTSSISRLAKGAEDGGADAIVAINTLKAMAISPEARMPILANRYGGLSGPAIRPVGVRCVFEIYETVDIPVVGVGGIESSEDALEYIMAGASAVQVGTAVWRHGPEVFRRISDGIFRFMDENGFGRIRDIVGVAHEQKS
jgi:dihydroorotate dehydrogenase (NAD+) catalytic subunit